MAAADPTAGRSRVMRRTTPTPAPRRRALASASGANAYDPRYGLPDLWQQGTQGQVSVKFIF